MGTFSELSGLKQWAAWPSGGALITLALYFTVFKSQRAANDSAQTEPAIQNARECRARSLPAEARRNRTPGCQLETTA